MGIVSQTIMRILLKQPVFHGKYPSFLFSFLRCVLTPDSRSSVVFFVVGIYSFFGENMVFESNMFITSEVVEQN